MAGMNPCKGCDSMHTDMCPSVICPSCYKGGSYYRKKTDDYRCPKCGDVWKPKTTEPKKDEIKSIALDRKSSTHLQTPDGLSIIIAMTAGSRGQPDLMERIW
jgi:ribosomal protein L37AE/L43A